MKKKIWLLALTAGLLLLAGGCGTEGEIAPVTREYGSGTRAAFEKFAGCEICESAITTNSSAVVLLTVSANENAIAYISGSALAQAGEIRAFGKIKEINITGGETQMRELYLAVKRAEREKYEGLVACLLSDEAARLAEPLGYFIPAKSEDPAVMSEGAEISIGGSSSLTALIEALAPLYPAKIKLQQSDSSAGLEALRAGLLDVALISRELSEEEKAEGLCDILIARDEIIVIANKKVPTDELSIELLKKIFSGEVRQWSETE